MYSYSLSNAWSSFSLINVVVVVVVAVDGGGGWLVVLGDSNLRRQKSNQHRWVQIEADSVVNQVL